MKILEKPATCVASTLKHCAQESFVNVIRAFYLRFNLLPHLTAVENVVLT
jgi:hypothetical protein